MTRGLFVDLDGTLCDSLAALRGAYREFVEERGGAPSEAEFEALNGATVREITARLREKHAFAEPHAELEAAYVRKVALARAASAPMEGAAELLEEARRNAWIVAVVTSGGHVEAEQWLAEQGREFSVALVVGGDDVVASKPAPDGYLAAVEALGCARDESIAVEDSSNGVRAALAAKLETFHFSPLFPLVQGRGTQGDVSAQATRIAKLGELIPRLEDSLSGREAL